MLTQEELIAELLDENTQLEEACLILMASNQKLMAQIDAMIDKLELAVPKNATIN